MDTYIADAVSSAFHESAFDIAEWLCVSGDIDDFIYYDEEPRNSER